MAWQSLLLILWSDSQTCVVPEPDKHDVFIIYSKTKNILN